MFQKVMKNVQEHVQEHVVSKFILKNEIVPKLFLSTIKYFSGIHQLDQKCMLLALSCMLDFAFISNQIEYTF